MGEEKERNILNKNDVKQLFIYIMVTLAISQNKIIGKMIQTCETHIYKKTCLMNEILDTIH